MKLQPLPIDASLPAVLGALAAAPNLILRSPTGSGKTTRVAPALLEADILNNKKIILCEPRRLAARTAAARIAFERESEIGGEIGYQVRFEKKSSLKTKILVVTEAILIRFLQNDPFLEDVGAVLFDEFHERNLDADLGLAMVCKLQREARPDIKIVAMSATLDAAPLSRFLENCNIIEAKGSLHPVEIIYIPRHTGDSPEAAVAAACARALADTAGDILVFLPGAGEIRRCREVLLNTTKNQKIQLFDLHGDLPPNAQDEAIARAQAGFRKIILSTNVAETSVTIDGVTAVVDSGLRKILKFDPAAGLDRLELGRISKVSAEQRAGRAGRTAPGVCYRLWSELEHRSLSAAEEPECYRIDLAPAFLQLRAWGERDPREFPWFEPPPAQALDHAEKLLLRLGALDDRSVTDVGLQMSQIPAHPRIARLLMEGARLRAPRRAALAAALLSERDPFRYESRRGAPRESQHSSSSDLLDRVAALESYEKNGSIHSEAGELHGGAASAVLRTRDQFLRIISNNTNADNATNPRESDEAILRAIFVAYADRLARRREPGSRRAVLAGGRGARLSDSSAVTDPEFFVCLHLDGGGADSLARLASEARREWIRDEWLIQKEELAFDDKLKRVVARRRVELDGMAVEEVIVNSTDREAVARRLAEAAAADPRAALPVDDPAVETFLARVDCLREWLPEANIPKLTIIDVLANLCEGRSSFAELQKAPLLDALRAKLDYQQLALLDREAPEQLQVPSGSFIKIQYSPGRPPVLAARIQELFGWKETPRLARGRVPVLLHLLAPNYRPQQITNDLTSFWNHTYQQIRKELRARYPKHSWPEDPWGAVAQRGARRRE